jgi:hypothetical protein
MPFKVNEDPGHMEALIVLDIGGVTTRFNVIVLSQPCEDCKT